MTQIAGRAAIVTAERRGLERATWLVRGIPRGMTGRRLATKYRTDQGGKEAAEAAIDPAGWQYR